MRKLTFKDTFKVAKIIKKANIKGEVTELTQKYTGQRDIDLEKAGIEIFMTLVEACGSEEVEREVYELLSSVFEVQDIEGMSIESIAQYFKRLMEENNLSSFFKLASQSNL